MNPVDEFKAEVQANIEKLGTARELQDLSLAWLQAISPYRYPYNFTWLGRPIIQLPQDMVAVQEIIWTVKPDLIVETGIAHGGSLIMSASLLALLDLCESGSTSINPDPAKPRKVIGIDIDIRSHNREALDAHPLRPRIELVQGSSIARDTVDEVYRKASGHTRTVVFLDSNHTHEHVLAELEAYAPLVSPGSYCVVFDTAIEDMPDNLFPDREWKRGNSPKSAVREYLSRLQNEGQKGRDGMRLDFEVDSTIDHKLLISVASGGYLKRV